MSKFANITLPLTGDQMLHITLLEHEERFAEFP